MDFQKSVTVALPYPEAVAAVRAALAEQGFGVITEIDMRATLHTKIGADIDPYVILGACNPTLAHQALQTDARVGVLLPCNVTVVQTDTGTRVSIMDPAVMTAFDGTDALAGVAAEAGTRLDAVLEALAGR